MAMMLDFYGALLMESERAIKVDFGDEIHWLPKSQIKFEEDCKTDDGVRLEIPEWLAKEKGLI